MATSTEDRHGEQRRQVRLNPEVRREQIVREATRLISEAGFNAMSLADVADACQIRKSSVLHYFPSMNDLLQAVLHARDRDEFGALGGLPHPLSPGEARVLFTEVLERNIEGREITRLYHILAGEALSPQHPAHLYFVERSAASRTGLPRMLAWKRDPQAAALQLSAFWQGIELEWLRDPHLDIRWVWNAFCDDFFD